MFLRPVILIAALTTLLMAGLSGCRCASNGCPPCPAVASCTFEQGVDTPPPNLASLVAAVDNGVTGDADAACATYEKIDAATCQCNAARMADTAELLQLERYLAGVLAACETGGAEQNLLLAKDLLTFRAAEERNQAAGDALSTFYQLASVEAQRSYLRQSVDEAAAAVERINRFEEQGLPLPTEADRNSLNVQLQALMDNALRLDLARRQLSLALRSQIGCPADDCRLLLPSLEWTPDLTPVDGELAVAEAIGSRPELRALRRFLCCLDEATLPIGRATLMAANGALGSIQRPPGPLHKLRCQGCVEQEVSTRRRQLRMLLADGVRQVTAEVQAASAEVTTQQERVRLATLGVQDRQIELNELEARRDVDRTSVFELSAARGRLLQAESDLAARVVDLKAAQAKLRKASGSLATECGELPRLCRLRRCPPIE